MRKIWTIAVVLGIVAVLIIAAIMFHPFGKDTAQKPAPIQTSGSLEGECRNLFKKAMDSVENGKKYSHEMDIALTNDNDKKAEEYFYKARDEYQKAFDILTDLKENSKYKGVLEKVLNEEYFRFFDDLENNWEDLHKSRTNT